MAVEDIGRMNEHAVVFPMANPTPEVDPVRARQHATVVASGRSDLPLSGEDHSSSFRMLGEPEEAGRLVAAGHSITVDVAAAFTSQAGNLRETLFALYDVYERRSRQ